MARGSGTRILRWLERGARVARTLGLGAVVDRMAPSVSRAVAGLEVEVAGFRLVAGHVGQLYYLRELAEEDRDAVFAGLVSAAMPEGGVAVEAGAHIGYITLRLAQAAGAAGRVLAFEPNPEVRATLEENLRRNGLAERVAVYEQALGDRARRARFYISGGGETSSLVDPGTARATVEVDVVRLDDEQPELVVDVVKLDIEGGEVAALEGMRRLLERSGDRVVVFAECNPELLRTAGASAAGLRTWLEEAGFRVRAIDEGARRLADPAAPLGEGGYVNLVAARGPRAEDLLRY